MKLEFTYYGRLEKAIMPVLLMAERPDMMPYLSRLFELTQTMVLKAMQVTEGI